MNAEEVIKRVDENTIGVVPTLGVTFNGRYELVRAACGALDKLQAERARRGHPRRRRSGGFLAPVLRARPACGTSACRG